MFAPWLKPDRCRAGMLGLRGAVAPDAGLFKRAAEEIAGLLKAEGVADMPVGVDLSEPPMLEALEVRLLLSASDAVPAGVEAEYSGCSFGIFGNASGPKMSAIWRSKERANRPSMSWLQSSTKTKPPLST